MMVMAMSPSDEAVKIADFEFCLLFLSQIIMKFHDLACVCEQSPGGTGL